MIHKIISISPEMTYRIGRKLGQACQPGDWFGFSGELGAGKTHFVQGLARGLGVDPAIPITSPTFVIHCCYVGRITLNHLDLYRLDGVDQLFEIGYDELLEQEGVVAVEWYQRIPEALCEQGLTIEIGIIDYNSRRIEMTALGSRGVELIELLNAMDY